MPPRTRPLGRRSGSITLLTSLTSERGPPRHQQPRVQRNPRVVEQGPRSQAEAATARPAPPPLPVRPRPDHAATGTSDSARPAASWPASGPCNRSSSRTRLLDTHSIAARRFGHVESLVRGAQGGTPLTSCCADRDRDRAGDAAPAQVVVAEGAQSAQNLRRPCNGEEYCERGYLDNGAGTRCCGPCPRFRSRTGWRPPIVGLDGPSRDVVNRGRTGEADRQGPSRQAGTTAIPSSRRYA